MTAEAIPAPSSMDGPSADGTDVLGDAGSTDAATADVDPAIGDVADARTRPATALVPVL